MSPKKNRPGLGKLLLTAIAVLTLFAASFALLQNRQYVADQLTVWQYDADEDVVRLVERAGMNNRGKFLYLASQPVLEGTQEFNNICRKIEYSVSVLGCYTSGRIYIYDVTDPRLDGIREVTAAHETLHAIYERLSETERNRVDALLEEEYQKLILDEELLTRMAFYDQVEPGQRHNELHSIIGTEVGDISEELEQYYAKYFKNRNRVVELYNQYSGLLASLTSRVNELADQLAGLSEKIASESVRYNNDTITLNADIATFNTRANNGDFSSQAQFNNERAILAARVEDLNNQRASINQDIALYNEILAEYNIVASEASELYESIDSTLAPPPSI